MRGRRGGLVLMAAVGLLALAGCFAGGPQQMAEGMEDPFMLEGGLERGVAKEHTKQISEALEPLQSRYSMNVDRDSYLVVMDGGEKCEDAREILGDLAFVRSVSQCEPVGS